jgi:hypothetical protein
MKRMVFYVDVFTGTFGLADDIVLVDATDWSENEVENFTIMTDEDRSAFANDFALAQFDKFGE